MKFLIKKHSSQRLVVGWQRSGFVLHLQKFPKQTSEVCSHKTTCCHHYRSAVGSSQGRAKLYHSTFPASTTLTCFYLPNPNLRAAVLVPWGLASQHTLTQIFPKQLQGAKTWEHVMPWLKHTQLRHAEKSHTWHMLLCNVCSLHKTCPANLLSFSTLSISRHPWLAAEPIHRSQLRMAENSSDPQHSELA